MPKVNYLIANLPATLYGAVTPIVIASAYISCLCYETLLTSTEFSGNVPANSISIVVKWYNPNKELIFTETTCTSNSAADNITGSVPVKGRYVSITIVGSISSTFTAATQVVLQQ